MRPPPLNATELRAALADVVGSLEVVERTGSTNADLLAAVRAGGAGAPVDRAVLVAEEQHAGRGRMDRRWTSPPGAGLTFSVLFRPAGVPSAHWGWLPLLAGLALVRTVRALTPVEAALKWPNDLLLGPTRAKGAGLLAEVAVAPEGAAVVVGIGLNVLTDPADLPEGGTSLRAQGAEVGRAEVLVELLRRLMAEEAAWRAAGGQADAIGLRADYRATCATIGSRVRIQLPGARSVEADAVDIDADGRLVVRESGGGGATRAVAAGDVVHLRPLP